MSMTSTSFIADGLQQRGLLHMEWCKLFARFPADIAVQRAGEKAGWLFILGMCYCAEEESDGFIPETQLPRFGLRGTKQRVAALLREDLWVAVDGGYQVASWSRLQRPTERIERKRERDRSRQAAKRAAQDDGNSSRNLQETEQLPGSQPAGSRANFNQGNSGANLPGQQGRDSVARDSAAMSPESRTAEVEGEKEIPPSPPAERGERSRCRRHKARPKSWCSDCQLPPLAAVPDKCGACSPSRRLEDDEGRDRGPCPNCHPSTVRSA
ncbi:hypothetical protein [Streptomyces synnematoformans]|uniref:Uncharacterized protein n=1 Tax=Streptomyces synnematoformans TaxID=415721 RepID=A0ABN2XCS3_9ACTN